MGRATLLKVPVPQLSRKSRDGPITAIYGGRPENGEQVKRHAHGLGTYCAFRKQIIFYSSSLAGRLQGIALIGTYHALRES